MSCNNLARVVVFISGRGSNLQSLINNSGSTYNIVGVICNKPQALGVGIAKAQKIAVKIVDNTLYSSQEEFESALAQAVSYFAADYIALAGFMRRLSANFVNPWLGKMLNIHPSLLPKYPGLNTHAQVLADKDAFHGATVHFVTADLDAGPQIARSSINVWPNATASGLAERVLELEHQLYPQVLDWLTSGRLQLKLGQVFLDEALLPKLGLNIVL